MLHESALFYIEHKDAIDNEMVSKSDFNNVNLPCIIGNSADYHCSQLLMILYYHHLPSDKKTIRIILVDSEIVMKHLCSDFT